MVGSVQLVQRQGKPHHTVWLSRQPLMLIISFIDMGGRMQRLLAEDRRLSCQPAPLLKLSDRENVCANVT
jgi:hypothetical protein